RERRSDVELLACYLLKECCAFIAPAPRAFSREALRTLTRYDWPGNVRELCNVVQRAALACDQETILDAHVAIPRARRSDGSQLLDFRTARAAALADFERRYLEESLGRHRGNVTHAAREARQDRRAFGRLIKKHRVSRHAL